MTAKTPDMTALPLQDPGLTARELLFLASITGDAATALQVPQRIAFSAWTGHIPFAFWVTRQCAPQTFVELGSHYGVSLGAFCQQALQNPGDCLCYAVDTWKGDEQAGFYGEEVFNDIATYMHKNYAGRAHLVRTTFDEAAGIFDDGGIDLLHIDGYHSKEAMLHDFETWLPKMSERGIILMHDINARIPGYTGFDAWREIAAKYPHFRFDHCYGLGVVLVGSNPPAPLVELASLGQEAADMARRYFSHAGAICEALFARVGEAQEQEKRNTEHVASLEAQIRANGEAHARELDEIGARHTAEIEAHERRREEEKRKGEAEARDLRQEIAKLKELVAGYANSKSWKLTEPLRMVGRAVRRKG